MFIIIGLGNPGKNYINTRHNAGFILLDKIKEKYEFPEFKHEKKLNAEISRSRDILLVKPQTFMNLSGQSIKSILDFYKLSPEDILVIHDDIDIELGKYKLAEDSRSAGHNGVQNIIDQLGTQKFQRIRIGIAKPADEKKTCPLSIHDYVLQKFSLEEMKILENVFAEIIKDIEKM